MTLTACAMPFSRRIPSAHRTARWRIAGSVTAASIAAANRQRSTFTPAANVAPNAINDAYVMVHYRFDHNRYLSRRRAEEELSWTQERHRTAQQLLLDAGIAEISGTQPRMTVATLDEALTTLGSFIVRAGMAPPPMQPRGWEE